MWTASSKESWKSMEKQYSEASKMVAEHIMEIHSSEHIDRLWHILCEFMWQCFLNSSKNAWGKKSYSDATGRVKLYSGCTFADWLKRGRLFAKAGIRHSGNLVLLASSLQSYKALCASLSARPAWKTHRDTTGRLDSSMHLKYQYH